MSDDPFGTEAEAPSFKFPKMGRKFGHVGTVIEWEAYHQSDFISKELQFWDEEKTRPKKGVVITLATDERDNAIKWNGDEWLPVEIDDDDGTRLLYCEGSKYLAVKEQLKETGAKLAKGGKLEIWWDSKGTPKDGKAAPKLYKVVYTPGEPEDPFAV